MKTVIDSWNFDDLDGLVQAIDNAKQTAKYHPGVGDGAVIYVATDVDSATQFRQAHLMQTILTDGSIVLDLVLS